MPEISEKIQQQLIEKRKGDAPEVKLHKKYDDEKVRQMALELEDAQVLIQKLEDHIRKQEMEIQERNSKIKAIQKRWTMFDKNKMATISIPEGGEPEIILKGPWLNRDYTRMLPFFARAVEEHKREYRDEYLNAAFKKNVVKQQIEFREKLKEKTKEKRDAANKKG